MSYCREHNVRLSRVFQSTGQKIRLRKDQYLIRVILNIEDSRLVPSVLLMKNGCLAYTAELLWCIYVDLVLLRKCKPNIPSDKNFRAFQLQQTWQSNCKVKPDLKVNRTNKNKEMYVSEIQKHANFLFTSCAVSFLLTQ